MEDDLRPEYDLHSLRVRKLGLKRKRFGRPTVSIQSDVAEIFTDSQSVNGAFRFEMKIFILEFP